MVMCAKCGGERLMMEGQGDGKTKVTCQECGYSTVQDQQGRRLLTDNMPAPGSKKLLTESASR